MGKITVTSLQAGCKQFEIETESKKAKELETLIDKALAQKELGYECPSCKKDIPDVKVCPYCGESFEDGEEKTDEEKTGEENTGNEEKTDADKVIEDAAKDVAEKVTDKKQTPAEKKAAEKAAADKKAADKKAADKAAADKKAADKKGKETPVYTAKKNEEFAAFVKDLDELLGKDFEKRERKTGVTYVKEAKRLMKAVSTGKTLVVEFNASIDTDGDNITKYTEEEAKAKHLGTTKAIYDGGDTKIAMKLAKEALKNFGK